MKLACYYKKDMNCLSLAKDLIVYPWLKTSLCTLENIVYNASLPFCIESYFIFFFAVPLYLKKDRNFLLRLCCLNIAGPKP